MVQNLSEIKIKEIYEFIANTTSNEISFSDWENGKKYISTTFENNQDNSLRYLFFKIGKENLKHHVHSHPEKDTEDLPSPGDLLNKDIVLQKRIGKETKFEIYMKSSKKYLNYTNRNSSMELDEIIITPKQNKP